MSAQKNRSLVVFVGLLLLSFIISGCDEISGAKELRYVQAPLFLPAELIVNHRGNVSIQGDTTIVSLVGTLNPSRISIAAEDDSLIVIILNENKDETEQYTAYRIKTGEVDYDIVLDGENIIHPKDRQVEVDITDGNIETIAFKKAPETKPGLQVRAGDKEWKEAWASLPFGYEPGMLTQWAYDDSTIKKWYGLGFLWFLTRLMLAAILFVVELYVYLLLMIIVDLIYIPFGETARNVSIGYCSIGHISVAFWFIFTRLKNSFA